MQIKGLDVSAWQHADPNHRQINWDQVYEDGYKFVIIKCTQGLTYKNPHFGSDFELAREAGLLVGAYHYAYPQMGSAEPEARFALSYTAPFDLDLGVTLDLETYGDLPLGSDLQTYGKEFLHLISDEHEDAPQYSHLSFFAGMGGPIPDYKVWLAARAQGEDYPGYWPRPWMEQLGAGPVSGIAGEVDTDQIMSPRGLQPPGEDTAPAPAEEAGEPETGEESEITEA